MTTLQATLPLVQATLPLVQATGLLRSSIDKFYTKSEIVQLCYVLPRSNLNLLPNKLVSELLRQHDQWYKGNCDFVWAYCRYFWEAHVEMNEIDITELEQFIAENRHLLLEK